MFAVVVDSGTQIIAILLVGIVIKLIDDYLDEVGECHESNDRGNIHPAQRLGKGVAPYGLLLFATAMSLDAGSACTLFFAAYVVGMVKDPDLILPTYLPTWGESLAVITGGIILWGYMEMLSSTTVMAAVQLIDDYADQKKDERENRTNLVHRWGKVEILLVTTITTLVSLLLDWKKTIAVFVLAPLISSLFSRQPRKRRVY